MSVAKNQNDTGCSALIVGDDSDQRASLATLLRAADITIDLVTVGALNSTASFSAYSQGLIVLLSADQADQDLAQLTNFASQHKGLRFVVFDGKPQVTRAVQSMKIGATDYLNLPEGRLNLEPFRSFIEAPQERAIGSTIHQEPKIIPEQRSSALNSNLQKLVNAAHFLASCDSLSVLCEGLMTILGETVGAEGGSLYLVEGDTLKRAHSLDPGHAPQTIPFPLKKGSVFETVLSSNEPLLLSDIDRINDIKLSGWKGYDGNSLLVYPLVEKNGSPIGLFSLHSKRDNIFTAQDREIALFLASFTRETIRALQAQEKTQSLTYSLRRTFDHMKDGIVLLDSQNRVAHFNHRFYQIMDIDPKIIFSGQPISEIYDHFFARGDLMNTNSQQCPWLERNENYSYEHYPINGSIVVVSGNLTDDGDRVLTFEDITKRKKWEEELYITRDEAERANRSKTDFLANISHELRTPLNAIIGFAEIMVNEVMGPVQNKRYGEYISHIHESGAHLLGVINNLLDLSKVEAGKFEITEEVVDIGKVIQNSVSYLQQQADAAHVDLDIEIDGAITNIQGDENALRQILLNLMSNAVKFTLKGGSVGVRGFLAECGGYRISVKDTGIGMSEDAILIACQPFGQVDSSLSRKYEGTGLGLPLTMSLIELHDGKLLIESEVGVGTEMIVCLPAERMIDINGS